MSSVAEVLTDRLALRRFHLGDDRDLRLFDSDPVAMATLGGVRTEEFTNGYVTTQVDHWDEHGFGWWMAFERSTGDFVGRGGIRYFQVEGATHVEVGYGLRPRFWGKGLATELADRAVTAAFDELRIEALVALSLPTNAASRRVLVKVGFAEVGRAIYKDLDTVRYEQSRTDWLGRPGMATSEA